MKDKLFKYIYNKKENKTKSIDNYSTIFLYLSIVFIVCFLLSNILASKLLKFGTFSVSAGILVFPISYIINDVLSEVYGYTKAKKIIVLGFILNIFMAIIFKLAIILPAPDFFENSHAFEIILGSTPRIVLAGLVAYLFGSLVNAKVVDKMKKISKNRFFVRAILSTIFGETVDSLIFVPIAFFGTMPFLQMLIMILLQVILKTLYEVICLPITTLVVSKIKRYERKE